MGNENMKEKGALIPGNITRMVVLLCSDFGRRQFMIDSRLLSRRTELEYRYLNFKIADAAAEIVGTADSLTMIGEIGGRVGYVNSELTYMSERLYKNLKSEVIVNIARKLHLSD